MYDNEKVITKTFAAGETLIHEGEKSDHVYLIIHGSVQILKALPDGIQPVAVISSGEILGEIGLLSNEPRCATAIALEDTKALLIRDNTLRAALEDDSFPLLRPLTKQLVSRLKDFESQHRMNVQRIERLENQVKTMQERLLPFDLSEENPL